jgi:hypothetical protein
MSDNTGATTRQISVTFRIDDAPVTHAEAKEMLVQLAIWMVNDEWLDKLAAELVACSAGPSKAHRKLQRVK